MNEENTNVMSYANKNEDGSCSGVVRVHDDVFQRIATISACQVNGVAQVGESAANQLTFRRLVGLTDTGAGVRLRKTYEKGNEHIQAVDVYVAVKEGHALPTVAEEVQKAVKDAVLKMTGTELEQVNVFVEAIEFEPADEPEPGDNALAVAGNDEETE